MTHSLRFKSLGIDTYKKPVIYLRRGCQPCRSEGFESESRILVTLRKRSIIATLNTVDTDLINLNEASLSEYARLLLEANEGDIIKLSHPKPLTSLSYVRAKIYGKTLAEKEIIEIIYDISSGLYSDIHISAFLTACSNGRLNLQEIIYLTNAMIKTGKKLSWPQKMVVDKHCVGGLPGNRTSPIVVAIVAAFGLTMPKTSSRSITSPAGTADTMEVLTTVEMDIKQILKVVNKENGCIVWGGNVSLSPADDILIRIEKSMDLDNDGQLVASILSKKIAAGSTHVLIDIPIGETAKVRSVQKAEALKRLLIMTGKALGIYVKVHFSDGTQPIGRGIGPSLEARDVIKVLQCSEDAPQDLREKSLTLAGKIIEFSSDVKKGTGKKIATNILDTGKAWNKFQGICKMQGGLKQIPEAKYVKTIRASKPGTITTINNRNISLVAKLAGAPNDKTAGVDLHTRIGDSVKRGSPLFSLQADSIGGLEYALEFIKHNKQIISIN